MIKTIFFILTFTFISCIQTTRVDAQSFVCCESSQFEDCNAKKGELDGNCECVCPKGSSEEECCEFKGGQMISNIGPDHDTKCCDCKGSIGQEIPECHGI